MPARPLRSGATVGGASVRLEQLRALAHPLRFRLFELFARQPRTTKQAATALGMPPTRLYHHVAALERVGLIVLQSTRPNRGTIEKYFSVVRPRLRGGPRDVSSRRELRRLSHAGGEILTLGALMLDRAREDSLAALAGFESGRERRPPPAIARITLSFTPAQLVSARRELKTFLQRIVDLSRRRGDGKRPWSLTLALLPVSGEPGKAFAPRARRRGRREE